jgi:iron complex outermembrane recepter protein
MEKPGMSNWIFRLGRSIVVTTAGWTVMAGPAQSAEAATGTSDENTTQGLQEIVVSATRRDETLGSVPVSVAAFSKDQMDAQGVRQIDDIAFLSPGLTFTHAAGAAGAEGDKTQIAIRGIQSSVGAATTGIYIDDTPIQTRVLATSSSNTYPQIFDLDRVEVLRGPQGTLFGAGAEGGTVRFITPQPGLSQYSLYSRSELSFTDGGAPSYEAGVAGGGPIVPDELGFRASAWFRRDGGWIDRVDPITLQTEQRNSNSQDSTELRLAFAYAPSEDLKITPSVLYQNLVIDDTSLYWNSISDPSEGTFNNGRTLAQPSTTRFALPALAVDYNLGFASLLSNTSFFNRNSTATRDYTNYIREAIGGSPYPLPGESAPVDVRDSQNVITQEIRLRSNSTGSVSWTAGLFYSHSKQYAVENYIDKGLDQTIEGITAGAPYCPPGGCNTLQFFGFPLVNGESYFYGTEDTLDTQYAAFAQVDYSVTERLKLTAGVRYADMEYTNSTFTTGPLAGGANLSGGKQVEHPITPKYGISYQADPNNLAYISVAKGFRPGGSNIIVSSNCGTDLSELGLKQVPLSYNSDNVWSYELGDKGNFAGGRLQVNSSAFFIKWNGIQQAISLPDCGGGFTANFGTAVSKGFDLQTLLRPTGSLSLGISAGYTDAYYTETVHGGAGSIVAENGEPIMGISKWSAVFSGQYDFKIGIGKSYARYDYEFIGEGNGQDPRVYGYDPALYPTPQETKKLSLRVGTIVNDWNFSLFADNVTNDEPVLNRGHDTLTSPIFTSYTYRPRTIGVTAIYKF